MDKRKQEERNVPRPAREFKYNEERPKRPEHKYPTGDKFSLYDCPGASARLLLEQVMNSLGGVHVANLENLKISPRDIIKYRPQIASALLGILREGPVANTDRLRGTAIAYLGELGFSQAKDVLTGIATSANENATIRGIAAEALCRLGGDTARAVLRGLLSDPSPIVRERAVRALGVIGVPEDGKVLADHIRSEVDTEVQFQATISARKLLPTSLHHLVPQIEKGPRGEEKEKLIVDANITRPIGRHQGAAPQSIDPHSLEAEKQAGHTGGRDLVSESRREPLPAQIANGVITYYVIRNAPQGYTRLQLLGHRLPTSFSPSDTFRIYALSDEEIIVDLPTAALPIPGHQLPLLKPLGLQPQDRMPTWVPEALASPIIHEFRANQLTIWRGEEFGLRVRFSVPDGQRACLLRLEIQLPLSAWQEATFVISEDEQAVGEKVISGYLASIAGTINLRATLYAEAGGAAKAETQLIVLPTNPISMSVVPQTRGTNGEGPAHYNAAEDRFYCYARFDIFNGFSHSVTVGPTVTCRVTDGGNHVATFSFSIGATTISANSTQSIFIFTRHGSSSDVYDVFEDFGDVTMQFTLQTTEGDISGSNVWAAMAQMKLALNFVGNMSVSIRATFQDVVENEASAIYEQQSLYISETQRFLLPSSHSDFSRYRDIRMNDNKDADCTAGSDEADDLRDDWSSSINWLDVWIVESFSGPACAASVGGFSPVDGPTAKDGDDSGVVIQLAGVDLLTTFGRNLMGIIVAHEVGHFLGLEHDGNSSNFMAASTGGTNTDITHGQYVNMADHGFVERFVP